MRASFFQPLLCVKISSGLSDRRHLLVRERNWLCNNPATASEKVIIGMIEWLGATRRFTTGQTSIAGTSTLTVSIAPMHMNAVPA